jgi:hypothetical protein
MTMTSTPQRTTPATEGPLPGRKVLVGLALVYLAVFVVLMATGADRSADDDPAKLIADYDISDLGVQLMTYGTVIAAAVLVFLGAGVRSVLRRTGQRWTADAAMLGFAVMGLTLVGFAMTSLALHHAVDIGDTTVVRAINVLDTTNFPLAMLALACAMVGTGITALRGGALPAWLCWTSIVLGVMAPLGPLGFAPFMLFPIWTVVVAAKLRLTDG